VLSPNSILPSRFRLIVLSVQPDKKKSAHIKKNIFFKFIF